MRGSHVTSAVLLMACGSSAPNITPENTGGQVAAAAEPFAVTPMAGPFASVEELCAAALAVANTELPDEHHECWEVGGHPDEPTLMPGAELPSGPQPLAAPFQSARFLAVGSDGPACHLAVEMLDGSWYGVVFGTCGVSDNRSSMALSLIDLAVTDLIPGGSPELRMRYRDVTSLSNLDNDGVHSESTRELHLVCGAGASSRPACVEPFGVQGTWRVEWLETDQVDPQLAAGRPTPGSGSWQRTVEYGADAIVLGGDGEPATGAEARTGRHPIAFP